MYKHILIPTDGSDLSKKAIKQGAAFAKSLRAKVTAVTVTPTFHSIAAEPLMVTDTEQEYRKDSAARAKKLLDVAKSAARAAGIRFEGVHAVNDQPFAAIISTARRKGCDLIFMASHGRKGISALILGSETTKVLTHTKIPVLVCR
ncbi:MAG TPA: universal stress protein [Burkholderiales bacterium]